MTERDDEPLPVDHPDRIAWVQRISDGALRLLGQQPEPIPWIKPMNRTEVAA